MTKVEDGKVRKKPTCTSRLHGSLLGIIGFLRTLNRSPQNKVDGSPGEGGKTLRGWQSHGGEPSEGSP